MTMLESAQTGQHDRASVETRFQAAARRADWRFLLPDPNLRDVEYVGSLPDDLLAALRVLSRSLEVVDALRTANATQLADVVVLHSPTRAQVRTALAAVKARGAIYCELKRSRRRPRSFLQFQTGMVYDELTRAGFTSIQTHWHYPSFSNCTRLVPLADSGAFAYWLASRKQTWLAQSMGLRWLTGARLLERVLPCISVVAQRGDR
ncbi:MAG: hypothetical protein J0M07_15565 [Anaerolineae bacterium]|nr:hypothetical protein [Anaerolineae bacterium]